ncbi:MAG TPA: YraN family protein [Myxococcales bacterium]|nr:YraN family protein [Myxococcales bacterium]
METAGRKELGDAAEQAAVELLERSGYRVVERNFRCPYGEVDVVAERGELLCFVEVRMRSSAAWGDPAHTVSWSKQRKVRRAALHWLFRHGAGADRMVRFDVISVLGRGKSALVEHIPDAFDAGM